MYLKQNKICYYDLKTTEEENYEKGLDYNKERNRQAV